VAKGLLVMQNSTQDNLKHESTDFESEISLYDVATFLIESWKKLGLAALLGLILGLGAWFFLGNYQAELILHNNTSSSALADAPNTYTLDLVSWRTIQKSLPNLADQITEEGKAPDEKVSLYKQMSQVSWWEKNVIPSFAITKADTKDLAAISKDFDGASTTILSLTVKSTGRSREDALDNVRAASQFLLQGGAYFQIKTLINGLESETIGTVADIQSKITDTQIELGYLKERAKSLEELRKRFPGSSGVTQQVIDPKESSAKYLPLSTQLIAVNTDINFANENLARYSDRLEQIGLMKTFLDDAIPLVNQNSNGIALARSLLEVQDKIRSKLDSGDVKGRQSMDGLRSQLLAIEARFTKGLEANTAPNAQKQGLIKSAAGGFFGFGFLMLLYLLARRIWNTIRISSAVV